MNKKLMSLIALTALFAMNEVSAAKFNSRQMGSVHAIGTVSNPDGSTQPIDASSNGSNASDKAPATAEKAPAAKPIVTASQKAAAAQAAKLARFNRVQDGLTFTKRLLPYAMKSLKGNDLTNLKAALKQVNALDLNIDNFGPQLLSLKAIVNANNLQNIQSKTAMDYLRVIKANIKFLQTSLNIADPVAKAQAAVAQVKKTVKK